ncbi:proprotein convertase P-domain-containing protein [candidate division KSB1 bacterium]|nr:proprotein convertase P-domain-containing protein [candidate division KSB1 bacterium]
MKLPVLKLAVVVATLALIYLALAAASPKPLDGKHCGRTVIGSTAERTPVHTLDGVHESGEIHLPIPDGPGGVATSSIQISGETEVTDLNVRVTITHPWVRDLHITLIAPNDSASEILLLRRFPGDSVENLTDCWFDDEADLGIYEGAPPFTGSFRPLQRLDSLDGIDPNGTWTLRVEDEFADDTGFIEHWAIEINRAVPLSGRVVNRVTRSPLSLVKVKLIDSEDSTTTSSQGRYEFADIAPGLYTLQFTKATYDTVLVSGVEIVEGGFTVIDTSLVSLINSVDYASDDPPVTIPDTTSSGVTMSLFVNDDFSVSDVDVTINLEHPRVYDLIVQIIDPEATAVDLVNFPQVRTDANLTETTLDDEAELSINDGTGPFTGRFRPHGTLSAIDGHTTRGEWQLLAADFFLNTEGRIVSFALHITVPMSADDPRPARPDDFELLTNYPNPFNSSTEFRFSLDAPQYVTLTLFDITGRQVSVLLNARADAGVHHVYLAAGNLPSGIYFARLQSPGQTLTRKIALVK